MKILVVDNYDSFTFNLCHLLFEVTGRWPLVYANDSIGMDEIRSMAPDAVVLSPGPGHPSRERDFGVCRDILEHYEGPVLGVCLGHQGIAHFFGSAVQQAEQPSHGMTSPIWHDGSLLFRGIPQGFSAVRYHSLAVTDPLSPQLERLAWTDDGVTMALKHKERPLFGVQFHPESILTEYGATLIRNFLSLVPASVACPVLLEGAGSESAQMDRLGRMDRPRRDVTIHSRTFDFFVPAEAAFLSLFGEEEYAFWLDSSAAEQDGAARNFLGGLSIPGSFRLEYSTTDETLHLYRHKAVEVRRQRLFDFLREWLPAPSPGRSHAFGFHGGFAGYLGYELKQDCGFGGVHRSALPDAQLIYTPLVLAIDDAARTVQVFWADAGDPKEQAELGAWIESTAERLRRSAEPPAVSVAPCADASSFLQMRDSRETYLQMIDEAKREIAHGESYELCLTTAFEGPVTLAPLAAYRRLRRLNPAPYSAFLRMGPVALACSSPERFLRVQADGEVSSKPIKGTAARQQEPTADLVARRELASSQKDRSEHLMILDLIRNDLGRVCEYGSVHVPEPMAIESYATVHQLVSTVSGRLRPGQTAIDAVEAAFPAGSMTGAPKRRTLEILDRLESGPRGIYSGSIGYFGLDGIADWNVVIRTAVFQRGRLSVGAGGGVVALSQAEAELDEVRLKAAAVIRSVSE